MKIKELINESISAHSTIAAITNDIGNGVNRTYEALEKLAQTVADNHGTLRPYPMLAGGVGSRWYQTFYVNRLQSELYDLVKYAPSQTKELSDFLKSYPESFGAVAASLPGILVKVAQRIKNRGLEQQASRWIARAQQHRNFMDQLRDSLKAENEKSSAKKPSQEKAPNVHGKQASAAEEAVNHVLKNLPKEVASEVRAAIAKSDNKLQALQRELVKRGIKL